MKKSILFAALIMCFSFSAISNEKPVTFIKEMTITDKSQCIVQGDECRIITSFAESSKKGSVNKTVIVNVGDTVFKKCRKYKSTGKIICDKYWSLKSH